MPHGPSKDDDLPELEIESLDDEPVDGVTIVSGPRGPIPWGVGAIIGAGLLLLVIVSGLGGHGPKSDQSDQAIIPTPTFVPSPVVTPPTGPLSLAFIYGRIAARVRMTEAIPSTQTVNFALEGAGGAPDRWYYLQVGVCPERPHRSAPAHPRASTARSTRRSLLRSQPARRCGSAWSTTGEGSSAPRTAASSRPTSG